MSVRSPSGAPGAAVAEASFSTGTDSPVRAASCIRSPDDDSRRRSAGAMLPSSSTTTSPTTRSRAATIASEPSRTTRAEGALMLRSASRDDCALRSCTMPMPAFTTTMAKMMPASPHSRSSAESAAATSRMSTMGSPTCSFTICMSVRGGFAFSSLGPFAARRRAASSSLMPSGDELTSASTTSAVIACHGSRARSASVGASVEFGFMERSFQRVTRSV